MGDFDARGLKRAYLGSLLPPMADFWHFLVTPVLFGPIRLLRVPRTNQTAAFASKDVVLLAFVLQEQGPTLSSLRSATKRCSAGDYSQGSRRYSRRVHSRSPNTYAPIVELSRYLRPPRVLRGNSPHFETDGEQLSKIPRYNGSPYRWASE